MDAANLKTSRANALHMAADLRRQLETLNVQTESVLSRNRQGATPPCLMKGMVELISQTTLVQTLALELVHRLSGNGGHDSSCPATCQGYCPWFQASRRVNRWTRHPDFDPEAGRLALYDYQRGISLALDLAEFFEQKLQLAHKHQDSEPPTQSAFCLSSWLRKLVQLLNLVGVRVCCSNGESSLGCTDR